MGVRTAYDRAVKAVLLCLICSCIRPNVLQCGDQICPSNNVCIADSVCATPEQIADCTGLADNATCHSEIGGDGYCSHGVCTPNVCGDGQITGVEPCDGSQVALTCADFGYYTGTTSCSEFCTVDRSACSGRCGDGVIDSDQGEDCDGSPPSSDCTDLGFDFGALTCATTCTADTAHSCSRFGWKKLGGIDFMRPVVGDAGMYAVIDQGVLEVHAATVSTHAGAFVALDARAGDVIAATTSTVDRYHAGVWTTLATPALAADQAIIETTLATDGTAFILANGATTGCSIGAFDGTAWTIAAGPSGCSHLSAAAAGDYAVAVGANVERQFPGCVATSGDPCSCMRPYAVGDSSTTIFAIHDDGGALYAWGNQTSSHVLLVSTQPQCGAGPPTQQLGSSTNYKYVLRGSDVFGMAFGSFITTAQRVSGNRTETFTSAPSLTGEPSEIFATRDGVVYQQGDGALYRLEPLTPTERTAPTGQIAYANGGQASIADDGTLVLCAENVFASNAVTSAFQQVGSLASCNGTGCCQALYARSSHAIFAGLAQLEEWNGVSWNQLMLGGATIGQVISLAGNAANVAAVQADHSVISTLGGPWALLPALPATCSANAVGLANDSTLYVAGGCPGFAMLWSYALGTWVEVTRVASGSGFGSISIGTDAAIAAATGTDVTIVANGVATSYANAGSRVATVTATDVFSVTTTVPAYVRHWDGLRWSPINVTADEAFYTIAATTSDLAVFGSQRISNPTITWESFVRVP